MIMGHFLKGSVLAAALVGAPAAATDWDSVGGWDVYEVDPARCVVGRMFADAGLTFGIIMSIDGEVRVFATGAGWPARAGEAIDAEVALDGKVLVRGASVGIEQQRNRGFVAAADKALLDGFAGARQLTVRAGTGILKDRLPLSGTAEALAQGRRCLSSLREERGAGIPPTVIASRPRAAPALSARGPASGTATRAPAALATRAIPRASLATWVGNTEYPAAALRAREEGATTVKLAINSVGEVAACEVARTSGSSALDEETCRIFKRRGRYNPARDTGGAPVESTEHTTIRWKLPD